MEKSVRNKCQVRKSYRLLTPIHVLAKANDEVLANALRKYHGELLTNNKKISARLLSEYGIGMRCVSNHSVPTNKLNSLDSATTVKRRRGLLGLTGSRATAQRMSPQEAEQLVLNQMDKDSSRRQGVRTVQARIAFDTQTHLPRDFVSNVMHIHDEEGFAYRDPSSKKILRVQKNPIGIHERWAGDGHDKLYRIGFPIWAVVDDATGKSLDAWVVPSNRMGHIIGYLFLCLVEKFGGWFILF